ncbi:hypothetical protein [Acinetobacter guillouiae]|uniref:hypothetical protein n=1 Tax=Acinetobacter guillouiae TaxID=106649 RepID=UPI0028D3DAA0|nr:hypothetical protein [Acinetobacter guillouiae]
MKNSTNSKSDYLMLAVFIVSILLSFGWYCAEAENEVLREELASQNYTQHIHHEDK